MDQYERTAFRYRDRAEQLRVMARYMKDKCARNILLEVAGDYDKLADLQDKLAELSAVRR